MAEAVPRLSLKGWRCFKGLTLALSLAVALHCLCRTVKSLALFWCLLVFLVFPLFVVYQFLLVCVSCEPCTDMEVTEAEAEVFRQAVTRTWMTCF